MIVSIENFASLNQHWTLKEWTHDGFATTKEPETKVTGLTTNIQLWGDSWENNT